jgi:hypothetical protein
VAARDDEPIAEWRTLLEERWQGADSAYAAVYDTLRRRGIPVRIDATRVRSDLLQPEVVNNRLVVTSGDHQIVVTVFPYGSSLYLGWTMSRGRRGSSLLGNFLKDLAGGMFGRAASIDRMLRAERARAFREAVHSAVREGAEVAAQGLLVPLGPAFGAEVPVRDLRVRAAPPPGYGPQPGAPVPGGYVAAGPGPDPYAPPASSPTPPPTVADPAKPKPSPHPVPPESSSHHPVPPESSSHHPVPSKPSPHPVPPEPEKSDRSPEDSDRSTGA